jgi:hypothetical protein
MQNRSKLKTLLWLAFFHVLCAFVVLCLFSKEYKQIYSIQTDPVSVSWNIPSDMDLSLYPEWLYFDRDSGIVYTKKVILDDDKRLLYNLVSAKDSSFVSYMNAINQLSYKSYSPLNLSLYLFVCCYMAIIGCLVRSMGDIIGRLCYKDGVNLEKWWSWYLLRPVMAMCCSVVFVLLCKFNMFKINDVLGEGLDFVLIIMFLLGFGVLDATEFMRKLSKNIFGTIDNSNNGTNNGANNGTT